MEIRDKEKLIPYSTLTDPRDYENLSVILLIIGFCLTSYFFMYPFIIIHNFIIAIRWHTKGKKEVYQKRSS